MYCMPTTEGKDRLAKPIIQVNPSRGNSTALVRAAFLYTDKQKVRFTLPGWSLVMRHLPARQCVPSQETFEEKLKGVDSLAESCLLVESITISECPTSAFARDFSISN